MAEVGSSWVSIVPSAKGFGSKLQKQLSGDLGAAGNAGGKRLGSGILASAKSFVAPLAGLFAVSAGVGFFKGAVDGASDLNESASKVGVVFGKQAGQILAASQTSASAMGLSKTAYLDATGGLGNLLVSLDIAPKKAAALSQQMVTLAGDMASFNNVSPEEALAALQSGLTGETEPLKRFGVNMNDATLKAQALKMHLIKTTKEAMSPQTKALAAQALIMDQTKTAQGDFARTSGGLANQQRILAARTEDLKTKIGGALLPAVTKATTAVSNFVGGMQDGTGAGGKFRDVLTDTGSKIGTVVGWLKDNTTAVKVAAVGVGVLTLAVQAHNLALFISTGGLKAWILQTTIVKTATAVWAAGQWLLNAALTANPIGLVVAAIALLIGGIVLIATKTTWFQTIWKVMTDALGTAWRWLWNTILAPIIRFVLNGFATITDGIASMLNTLSNIPGFGWAKTAADKMAGAAAQARAVAKGVKDIPPNKTITVKTLGYAATYQQLMKLQTTIRGINGLPVRIAMGAGGQGGITRATGGPVMAGHPYIVGDGGRPEWFVPDQNGTIIPRVPASSQASGGSSPAGGNTFYIYEAVSAEATAMQVSRRQAALGAI